MNWRDFFRPRHPDTSLEWCTECRTDFVVPIDWEPCDEERWLIDLRCGQCEHRRIVNVPNSVAKRYDIELDVRVDQLNRSLRRMEREGMERDVEKAAHILNHCETLYPEDII